MLRYCRELVGRWGGGGGGWEDDGSDVLFNIVQYFYGGIYCHGLSCPQFRGACIWTFWRVTTSICSTPLYNCHVVIACVSTPVSCCYFDGVLFSHSHPIFFPSVFPQEWFHLWSFWAHDPGQWAARQSCQEDENRQRAVQGTSVLCLDVRSIWTEWQSCVLLCDILYDAPCIWLCCVLPVPVGLYFDACWLSQNLGIITNLFHSTHGAHSPHQSLTYDNVVASLQLLSMHATIASRTFLTRLLILLLGLMVRLSISSDNPTDTHPYTQVLNRWSFS